MRSATLFVVSCVIMFFVMHHATVVAEDKPPVLVYIVRGTRCGLDGNKQCLAEIKDSFYTRCNCLNSLDGHQCTCSH
ncbi:hypothetical protein EUTSA_v10015979mg [Eutrema salsugineum]|uniref:EGF-like domain-containing protein n=1 Tax=Eutrema salsugineum TaxID=72664 RepID=V4LM49_EUTSA|nr:hypothetical protein EUTSA_v10015979mg [Eutrema salsugineum]